MSWRGFSLGWREVVLCGAAGLITAGVLWFLLRLAVGGTTAWYLTQAALAVAAVGVLFRARRGRRS